MEAGSDGWPFHSIQNHPLHPGPTYYPSYCTFMLRDFHVEVCPIPSSAKWEWTIKPSNKESDSMLTFQSHNPAPEARQRKRRWIWSNVSISCYGAGSFCLPVDVGMCFAKIFKLSSLISSALHSFKGDFTQSDTLQWSACGKGAVYFSYPLCSTWKTKIWMGIYFR